MCPGPCHGPGRTDSAEIQNTQGRLNCGSNPALPHSNCESRQITYLSEPQVFIQYLGLSAWQCLEMNTSIRQQRTSQLEPEALSVPWCSPGM